MKHWSHSYYERHPTLWLVVLDGYILRRFRTRDAALAYQSRRAVATALVAPKE